MTELNLNEKLHIMQEYPFFISFLNHKIDQDTFLSDLNNFKEDLLQRDLNETDLNLIAQTSIQSSKRVECEGRFSGFSKHMTEALELTLEEKKTSSVTEDTLKDAFDLIKKEALCSDPNDPYFHSTVDILRPNPLPPDQNTAYLYTVPFIPRILKTHPILPLKYCETLGAKGNLLHHLSNWHFRFDICKVLGIRLSEKIIGIKKKKNTRQVKKGKPQPIQLDPEKTSLAGYKLRTKFGLGRGFFNIVVPDAPFSIEVLDHSGKISLLIGFWYKNEIIEGSSKNIFVISQIQQPTGTSRPGQKQGSHLGIVGMEIGKIVAKALGFDVIQTYSAEKHPMFLQYPKRKPKMKGEFRGYYDSSAKALGFNGSRTTFYTLNLN